MKEARAKQMEAWNAPMHTNDPRSQSPQDRKQTGNPESFPNALPLPALPSASWGWVMKSQTLPPHHQKHRHMDRRVGMGVDWHFLFSSLSILRVSWWMDGMVEWDRSFWLLTPPPLGSSWRVGASLPRPFRQPSHRAGAESVAPGPLISASALISRARPLALKKTDRSFWRPNKTYP